MGLGSDEEFRAKVIGASEVAALFGVSPWKTYFQLWHEKKGTVEVEEFATTEYQQAGVYLEPSIIKWACDKWGYAKARTPKRAKAKAARLGGHPDQMVTHPERGKGVLEIKTVDRLIYKQWEDGEPPVQYQLQAMVYAGITGADFADIIVLVGGNELQRFAVPFSEKLYGEILDRVNEFWRTVALGIEPEPDYDKDGEMIGKVYHHLDLERVEIPEARDAAARYRIAAQLEKQWRDEKAKAQAEITHLIGKEAKGSDEIVKKVICSMPGWQISSVLIEGKPDRAAEPGEIIKGRKPYRRLYFKELDV